eukprot:c15935_g1_i1 orf=2-1318(-)
MGRAPCCEKVGLKKGPWTPEEDQVLIAYIREHGYGSWRALPKKAGLLRCGKSCRLRWANYLKPDIKRGKFSLNEEQTIIQLHALLGNRWSAIASHLPKRTDNEIKNYWNTHLKKRLMKMGIDPITHRPKSDTQNMLQENSKFSSNFGHMAQWESARLEAEARLAKESKIYPKSLWQNPDMSSSTLSSMRAWNRQCCDLLSKSEIGLLAKSLACTQGGAVESVSMIHNWVKTLQRHNGFLSPGSASVSSSFVDAEDSKVASSHGADPMDLGSPTSTLCCLEQQSQSQSIFQPQAITKVPFHAKISSWDDKLLARDSTIESEIGIRLQQELESSNLQCVVYQLDDVLQSTKAPEALTGTEICTPFGSLQDFDVAGKSDPCLYPSPTLLSESSSLDNVSTELGGKRDKNGVLITTPSSSHQLGELDFVLEDITRNSILCSSP